MTHKPHLASSWVEEGGFEDTETVLLSNEGAPQIQLGENVKNLSAYPQTVLKVTSDSS